MEPKPREIAKLEEKQKHNGYRNQDQSQSQHQNAKNWDKSGKAKERFLA